MAGIGDQSPYDVDIKGGRIVGLRELQAFLAEFGKISLGADGIAFKDGTIQTTAPAEASFAAPGSDIYLTTIIGSI